MFLHSYDCYMKHAFPFDLLDPVNLEGIGNIPPKWIETKPKGRIEENSDQNVGLMMTLVDSMDTLAVIYCIELVDHGREGKVSNCRKSDHQAHEL